MITDVVLAFINKKGNVVFAKTLLPRAILLTLGTLLPEKMFQSSAIQQAQYQHHLFLKCHYFE
jgi:hypothetical protein